MLLSNLSRVQLLPQVGLWKGLKASIALLPRGLAVPERVWSFCMGWGRNHRAAITAAAMSTVGPLLTITEKAQTTPSNARSKLEVL